MKNSSPTSSTHSHSANLIRSYTTSSDTSASEQLAAISKAREERKKQRERTGLFKTEVMDGGGARNSHEGVDRMEEQQVTNDSSTTSSQASSPSLPKLRIQPSSDSSFTPSIPSSPSKSSGNLIDSTPPTTKEDDLASTTPRPSSPLRNSIEIAEIPPFRPKSASPTNTSPISSPPPTNVILSGGLLERLKAQRAAQAAKASSHSESPPPSSHGLASGTGDRIGSANEIVDSASSESVNEASLMKLVTTSLNSSRTPSTVPARERPPSPLTTLDRPSSPASSFPDSLPPLTRTSTAPSSFVAPEGNPEDDDDVISELSQAFSQPERSKSRSRIYGRYGEEIDYDFTALSDVQERSERSSMSTVQGSLWQGHLRQNSLPISETLPSNRTRSSTTSPLSSTPMTHSRSSPSLVPNVPRDSQNRRLDATPQLLGRSSSHSKSIFDDRSNAFEPTPSRDVPRIRSPIRNTSPEIARRASQFEAPSNPTSLQFPALERDGVPSVPVDQVPPSLLFEDSLAEIERRRAARRARLDSICNLYSAPPAEPEQSAQQVPLSQDRWDDIERQEQEQVDEENLSREQVPSTSESVAASLSSPRSPMVDTFCEGYLSVSSDKDRESTSPTNIWASRYSVLTSETLSFRPTDQNSLQEPVIVLELADCDRVEEEVPPSFVGGAAASRPFSVVLKSGERKQFVCEKGSERVRWIVALENAIQAIRSKAFKTVFPTFDTSGTRSSAPPSSAVPRVLEPSPSNPTLPHPPPLPLPQLPAAPSPIDIAGEPQKHSHSIWSRSKIPSKSTNPFAFPLQDIDNIAASARSSSPVKPLSPHLLSRFDERQLPALPSPSLTSKPHGHARSRSALAAYRTPNEEPPFRPSPTRPKSSHVRSKTEEYLAASNRSERSSSSSSSLTYLEARSITPTQGRFNFASSRAIDTETVTSRGELETASEKAAWSRTREGYENEARQFARPSPSSAHPRKRTHPHHQFADSQYGIGGAPSSHGRSGFRLPLGKKSNPVVPQNARGERSVPNRIDPFAKSAAVEPQAPSRSQPFNSERTESSSSVSRSQSLSSDPRAVEDVNLLWTIRDTLENQRSTYEDDKARQEVQAQAISALAHWVTEDTRIRQEQHDALGQAVESIVQQVATLPQQLLAIVENPALLDASPAHAPNNDDTLALEDGGAEPEELGPNDNNENGETTNLGRLRKKNSGKGFIINPLSSFATAARVRAAEQENANLEPSVTKPKGPRMPAIRLWGAPEPSATRSGRWGEGAAALNSSNERELGENGGPRLDHSEDVLDSTILANGEALGRTSRPENGTFGPEALSDSISEILQALRDLAQKQNDQATRSAEERAKSHTLSAAERVELESKKAEIARIEQVTSMNAERTAKINDMVAQLARKTDRTDKLLAEIAKSVQAGRTTTMDPALTSEIKKLLGGVQSSVDAHVTDFRGKLTSEVQRMFKEVEKLRDEKKSLQTEIADLMAFHAKYSGTIPKSAAPLNREEPQLPTQDRTTNAKISSFYGPRVMK